MGVGEYSIEGIFRHGQATVAEELQQRGYSVITAELSCLGDPETCEPLDGLTHKSNSNPSSDDNYALFACSTNADAP